jgi:hypothetical protein
VRPLEVFIWILAFLIIRRKLNLFFTSHREMQQVLDKTKKSSHSLHTLQLCTPSTRRSYKIVMFHFLRRIQSQDQCHWSYL